MSKVETFRPPGFNGPRLGGVEGRATATRRGYGSRWQRYSRRYRLAHPACVRCQRLFGRTVKSEHVDHINCDGEPGAPEFWQPVNHQALCQRCHTIKTAAEQQGRRFTPADPFPGPAPGEGAPNP